VNPTVQWHLHTGAITDSVNNRPQLVGQSQLRYAGSDKILTLGPMSDAVDSDVARKGATVMHVVLAAELVWIRVR